MSGSRFSFRNSPFLPSDWRHRKCDEPTIEPPNEDWEEFQKIMELDRRVHELYGVSMEDGPFAAFGKDISKLEDEIWGKGTNQAES